MMSHRVGSSPTPPPPPPPPIPPPPPPRPFLSIRTTVRVSQFSLCPR